VVVVVVEELEEELEEELDEEIVLDFLVPGSRTPSSVLRARFLEEGLAMSRSMSSCFLPLLFKFAATHSSRNWVTFSFL